MQLFKRFLAAPLLLVFAHAPLAQAAWQRIEVIAFEHRSGNDTESFTSDVGEPQWAKGIYLMDEEEAAERRQELIAKAQAAERADAAAAAAPASAPEPKPEAPAEAKPPEGFVSVESLLEQNVPKPAPTPQAATTETKPAASKKIYEVPFVDLPSSAFTLNRVESYLEDNRDYRILAHVAWRQPALSNNTEMVRIYGGDVVASGSNLRHDQPGKIFEFEALVTLSRSKYFHLDVDAVCVNLAFNKMPLITSLRKIWAQFQMMRVSAIATPKSLLIAYRRCKRSRVDNYTTSIIP